MDYLEEIKKTELDILTYISNICEKHNLRYYLMFGTLLGAVRHKGFIPWDDDIDIAMPREDYIRFTEIIENTRKSPFKIASWEHDKGYPYIFPKIIDTRTKLKEQAFSHLDFDYGVYVDIFILDGLPKNKIKRVIMEKQHKLYYQLIRYYYLNAKYLNKLLKTFQPLYKKIINIQKIKKSIDKMYLNYNFDDSELCRIPLGFTPKAYLKTEYFQTTKKCEFEGKIFNCPGSSHECLVSQYGENYMNLPPKEERITHHNFVELEINNIQFKGKDI